MKNVWIREGRGLFRRGNNEMGDKLCAMVINTGKRTRIKNIASILLFLHGLSPGVISAQLLRLPCTLLWFCNVKVCYPHS